MKTNQQNIINTCGCFRFLDQNQFETINRKKTSVSYLKGETICKQGAFAPHVLFVNTGLVRVYLQTGPARQLSIRVATAGDFLAFNAVFDERVYSYSAVAITDTDICMIEKNALKEVILANSVFSLAISARNSKDELRYLQIISNLSYKQMRGKLASALLYLLSDERKEINVIQYLTRQDIADFASITLESAIRFLKEFEKEGIIIIQGKDIRIIDQIKLDDVARNG